MYQHVPQKARKTYFTECHLKPDISWEQEQVQQLMDHILNIRKDLNKSPDFSSLNAEVTILCSKKLFKDLQVRIFQRT